MLPSLVIGVALTGIIASCQDPTQLTLIVSTNAKCHDELRSTAIYVSGTLGSVNEKVQTSSPVAQTDNCNAGDIGTLVVTPGNSQGAVVVIGGFYGKSPTECVEGHYDNCIVARRSFTFIKHAALNIPIPLERSCLNVPCSANTTCHNGACYDAAVECLNGACDVPGTTPDAGSVDAGPMAIVEGGGPPDKDGGTTTGSDSGGTQMDGGGMIDGGNAADGSTDSGIVTHSYDASGITCAMGGMTLVVNSCVTLNVQCAIGQGCCAPVASTVCGSPATCEGVKPVSCCANSECPLDLPCCSAGSPPANASPPPIAMNGVCAAVTFLPGGQAGHCAPAP